MRKTCGFTLIELLAVLVIVGLAASLVVISIGTGSRSGNLEVFTKNLRNTLGFAIEEAVLFNQQLGMVFDVEVIDDEQRFSYRFLVFDQDKERWYENEDKDLKKTLFPPQIDLRVEVDGEELTIGGTRESIFFKRDQEEDDDEKKSKLVPDLIFFSSGETQKFVITINPLDNPDKQYQISANILGQLSMKLPGQKDD